MIKCFISALAFLIYHSILNTSYSQYAPQYPHPGHVGISKTDSRIIGWADLCSITRGPKDIYDLSLGLAEAGTESNATGPADGFTISLGDGGVAVIEFLVPIINGEGPDFAVFENGFSKPTDNKLAFLELAHVEVSNDGINYYRFPSHFNLYSDTQHTNDTYLDASIMHNLAGKYVKDQGTPFDLEDLAHIDELDLNNIKFVKIIDVIGIFNDDTYSNYDSEGNVINDPYPTPFPTGGFDLDAIAALHQAGKTSNEPQLLPIFTIKPNPATNELSIHNNLLLHSEDVTIYNSIGQNINEKVSINYSNNICNIDISQLSKGVYFIKIKDTVKSFLKL